MGADLEGNCCGTDGTEPLKMLAALVAGVGLGATLAALAFAALATDSERDAFASARTFFRADTSCACDEERAAISSACCCFSAAMDSACLAWMDFSSLEVSFLVDES